MNEPLETIRNQIHQCEKLLHVYQKEHRLLLNQECREVGDVSPLVETKLRLMRTFELQQQFITTLKSEDRAADIESRELLRELGRRIEQLLVIDRENELLLRRLLNAPPEARVAGAGSRGLAARPARPVTASEAAHA